MNPDTVFKTSELTPFKRDVEDFGLQSVYITLSLIIVIFYLITLELRIRKLESVLSN